MPELPESPTPAPWNVLDAACPSRQVLELIANKWSVLVLCALRDGRRRYSELHRLTDGISQKMLTQTLRDLERNGLVRRIVYPVVPPHTEYERTELGAQLQDVVYRLGEWAQANVPAVLEARARYDGDQG